MKGLSAEKSLFYVPWPDVSEWKTVRRQIFSSDINQLRRAFETILMWKVKFNRLPAYIECTYTLLQVMINEYDMTKNENSNSLFTECDLQLSYSTALIRFVNHVSSVSLHKGKSIHTLYLAAKNQNIPNWIIDMRHDVSHGQNLPSLDALHVAAELSLKWVLDNYWANGEHFEERSLDVSQPDIELQTLREIDIDSQNVFMKVFELWELCYAATTDGVTLIAEMGREFIMHIEELLNLNEGYFNEVENEAVNTIQSIVQMYNQNNENDKNQSKTMYSIKQFKLLLLEFLKNIIKSNNELKESLIMSLIQTTFLVEKNFNPSKWRPVIVLLQELGCFSFLLEILLEMAGRGHKGAAKWLSILPASIRNLRKRWAMFKVLKKENNNFKTKQLKKRVDKSLKGSGDDSIFKLEIFKPPVVTLGMVKSILLNPEQFTVNVIVEFLKLVKPPLMSYTIDMIKDLASLQTQSENNKIGDEVEIDEIFTVDDLQMTIVQQESLLVEEAINDFGWVKSSIDVHAWNKCPLGLLPFQSKVNCTLPESLIWKKKSSKKRGIIPLIDHSMSMKKMRIVE